MGRHWLVRDTGRVSLSLRAFVSFGKGAFILSFCSFKTKGNKTMKKTAKTLTRILSILLCLTFFLALVSCNQKIDAEGLWQNATYRSDKEFGNGAKTVQVEVKVSEQSITFTLHTDKNYLGEALLEHDLIAGEQDQYGLYVKQVNGITADYDVDQSYWGLYKNGEYGMTGIDATEIADGEHYELVYTK